MGDIVDDSHGESLFRMWRIEFVEHGLDHRRREFFRRQSIATTDDTRHRAQSVPCRVAECLDDVETERLGRGARLFGAVEHSDRTHCRGQNGGQLGRGKGPIHPNPHQADLATFGVESLDGLVRGTRAGAHQHDYSLGIGRAGVVDKPVLAPGLVGETFEGTLDDLGHGVGERVARLTRLEEHVGVLRRAAQHRMIGVERTQAKVGDPLLVDQGRNVFVRWQLDRGHFV